MTVSTPPAWADHPFVAGLAPHHLEILVACARTVRLDVGGVLAREGDPADALFLIRSGRAAIELHTPGRGPAPIETIGPGGAVGWSWIVPPHRWTYDARALEPLEAIVLDAERLRQACTRDHEFGYQILTRLLAVIAERLSATRVQLLDLYG